MQRGSVASRFREDRPDKVIHVTVVWAISWISPVTSDREEPESPVTWVTRVQTQETTIL